MQDWVFRLGAKLYKRPSLYYVSKWTGWVGSEKGQFFADVQFYIYANVGWMGGSEKFEKCT